MKTITTLFIKVLGFLTAYTIVFSVILSAQATEKPNIILIFLDDAGYGDVGFTGASSPTPNIDMLAEQGARLNQFYVAQAACSSSRAALLTGRYPNRFDFPWVLSPGSPNGIPDDIVTLPEFLKSHGYSTSMFGKWHLGDHPDALPPSHGFDEYLGIPYSGDMADYNPTAPRNQPNEDGSPASDPWPPIALYEGSIAKIPDARPEHQKLFTKNFTDSAIDVITRDQDDPFFIYLAYNQPHVMLYASDEFEGKTGKGLYRDVMTEIDYSLGRLKSALKQKNIDENTLIIFTSDNGPWRLFGNHGGSTGPFREEKGTSFEGGSHMFGVMNWPAQIKAGTIIDQPAMTVDIYKTIATMLGSDQPNAIMDGRDIMPLLKNEHTKSEEPFPYYFYKERTLEAMRYGKWKFYFPHNYRHVSVEGNDGGRGEYIFLDADYALYDLTHDAGEEHNLVDQFPEIAKMLREMGHEFEKDLDAKRTKPAQHIFD
ncbi:MAG: sulfatase [Kordiimonadaceae bacterium]|jgi:arylsulfatase A|nr:sulfatase [Kordiimonadaceae bacterium]MBT6033478.1 sulfatase [Kordiimonadaceae bacterium]